MILQKLMDNASDLCVIDYGTERVFINLFIFLEILNNLMLLYDTYDF